MEKLEPKQFALPGSICDVHNLYQTKPDERGKQSWTEKYPDDLVDPAESSESGRYALLVRNAKCYDGRKSLQIHSIVVQSKPLKTFLANVMRGYPGITMELDRVEFKRPFKPFVHRWEQLIEARDSVRDITMKSHVDLLYEVLEEELRDIISSRKSHIANGVVTHDLLWSIFEPDDLIFSPVDGRQRVFSFRAGEIDRKGNFDTTLAYIDFDGDKFGYMSHSVSVPPYEGTLPITALPAFPLVYHSKNATIREDLIARGKLWEDHKGYHYKQYEGVGKTYFCGREIKLNVKSRIVIDTEAYNTFNPDEEVNLNGRISSEHLSDDQRLISTPIVRGYALKDKRWLEFYIDGVTDITWDQQAFDSLVLPHARQDLKQLILAFADAQSKNLDEFDDIIQGKGRGVVMLLSGPPGVGKTLTAESVAEVMKVPLYVLSAGDLGTSASKVENSLKDIMSIVPRWGAVLLLDEADVFMETRNTTDLVRNELVSIFLRTLEYYEVSN